MLSGTLSREQCGEATSICRRSLDPNATREPPELSGSVACRINSAIDAPDSYAHTKPVGEYLIMQTREFGIAWLWLRGVEVDRSAIWALEAKC